MRRVGRDKNPRCTAKQSHRVEGFTRGGHGLVMSMGDYARFAPRLLNGGQLDGGRVLGRKTVLNSPDAWPMKSI